MIADEGVTRLFKSVLLAHKLEMQFFTFPPGEKYKTRETKQAIEDEMLNARFGRESAVIALGGGVVTDLGGFVAATYLRGLPLILIPTTLTGMVDAAIGGKTGVNTPQGKNLIGAFYPATLVVSDINCLASLSEQEMRNGRAEILKYALTFDPTLLEIDDLETVVRRCSALKESVTRSDFREEGRRRVLNFGHTVGHALEKISAWTTPHGEAVAHGMVIESLMSVEMGILSEETFSTLVRWIKRDFPRKLPTKDLFSAMMHDKKGERGTPRFVVLKDLGEVLPFDGKYCTEVKREILEKAVNKYAQIGN